MIIVYRVNYFKQQLVIFYLFTNINVIKNHKIPFSIQNFFIIYLVFFKRIINLNDLY